MFFILIPVFAILILGVTLVIQCCNRHWFINDVIDFNPCKLIYQVTRFAIKHKYPLWRSAFTYCKDEIPTRIGLGKERYGGPFTTEQVEDVKTFLNILRVLLALGPIFAVDIAASNQLPTVAYHLAGDSATALLWPIKEACSITYPTVLALNGSITPLIITFIIPLHIDLLRPFIKNHILRMLKRIGLGMVVLTLSLISTLLLDTVGYIHSSSTTCFLSSGPHFNHTYDLVELPSISPLYIIIPYTLNSFAYVFLYIGAYECILSQSPHAMQGLVIGIFFAIKGVFQLLAVLTVYLPFISWSSDSSFPSCGCIYYLINIVIALIGIMVYTWAAVKYQYRQRDDILPNMHIFAECYYSRGIDDDADGLLHRVKAWVRRVPIHVHVCSNKDNPPSTSQATNTHKQENATGNSRRAKVELPDHISSRNKSEK